MSTTHLLIILLMAATAAAALAQDDVPYSLPDKPWEPSLGNHRAVVSVEQPAAAVWAHLPWRRRDRDPEAKAVLVTDAAANAPVKNALRADIRREYGDVVFEAPHAGTYYLYYLPFTIEGSSFPTTHYTKPADTADAAWLARVRREGDGWWRALPQAKVTTFQARDDFNRFDPMEVVASPAEVAGLLARHPDAPFLLFPEDRRRPIRMTDDLPLSWVRRQGPAELRGEALRNEFYAFQVGLFAARADLQNISVVFGDLTAPGRRSIPASAIRCFNTGGTDWLGRPMVKQVDVPRGKVQALWCGVDVPKDAAPGEYHGTVRVGAEGVASQPVALTLTILPQVRDDRGDADLWRMSRLRWLDSTIGLEEEVTAPYTPVRVEGATVFVLGRSVTFGGGCLPRAIHVGKEDILAAPARFVVQTAAGALAWKESAPKVARRTHARAVLQSEAAAPGFHLASSADMEFDGYINLRLTLRAERDADLSDCRLEIPLKPEFATYLMGMGQKGGYRPAKVEWHWDQKLHQDSVWVGDVAGGLQCKLKGPDYRWPLVNIHYHRRPLIMPEAWDNGGRGGCVIEPAGGDRVVIRAYGGPRHMKAGQELHFDVGLLVTPVKPLNAKAHWSQRYYHGGQPDPKAVKEAGANIINIHHANPINPYINYPFLNPDAVSAYTKSAHDLGLKVKIYYTIRELSNHCAEIWALRSLGQEIYADGPGGGYAWLHEHLGDHYSPAWHQPFPDGTWCASISQTGLSRWHNYYLEGLSFLCRHQGIDGLYLDEIGYDREIMKRVRRVLDRARPGSLLDLHSWNHFNGMAGWANCLNLYLEHLPYLDSLWIGEGRNYDEGPDHWMVEISGIPFGLFSEMLEGGGNPWRGMLYGMTNRLPWSGNPRPIWKLWDRFGIADSEMLGYWAKGCPVRTGRDDVLATVYRRKGKAALVCVASWAKEPVDLKLKIDWPALGLDPAKAKLYAPAIEGLQKETLFAPTDALPVEPRSGWMLIVDEAAHTAPAPGEDPPKELRALWQEPFAGDALGAGWKSTLSTRPGTQIGVAAGEMVINCTANTCAFADHPLPAGTTAVECELNSGTDGGQTWGLGLGLVWPNAFARIHLRAEDRRGRPGQSGTARRRRARAPAVFARLRANCR